ncbi:MAG: hypothetical protein HC905_26115 [Bacteroidales bacterium]|nr:hypothetical protein [Bacteroidales bacterium]
MDKETILSLFETKLKEQTGKNVLKHCFMLLRKTHKTITFTIDNEKFFAENRMAKNLILQNKISFEG